MSMETGNASIWFYKYGAQNVNSKVADVSINCLTFSFGIKNNNILLFSVIEWFSSDVFNGIRRVKI